MNKILHWDLLFIHWSPMGAGQRKGSWWFWWVTQNEAAVSPSRDNGTAGPVLDSPLTLMTNWCLSSKTVRGPKHAGDEKKIRELGLYRLGRKDQWWQKEISLQSSHLKRGCREDKAQRGNHHKGQQNKPLLELSENSLLEAWFSTGTTFPETSAQPIWTRFACSNWTQHWGYMKMEQEDGLEDLLIQKVLQFLMYFEIQIAVFSEKSDCKVSVYFLF